MDNIMDNFGIRLNWPKNNVDWDIICIYILNKNFIFVNFLVEL